MYNFSSKETKVRASRAHGGEEWEYEGRKNCSRYYRNVDSE
jgi:hypothetical protein